jgi:hypothetical protein
MTENYIVLKGKRYDLVLPKDSKCEDYDTCQQCPLNEYGCSNLIDTINDTFDITDGDEVVTINHVEL